MSEPEPTWQTTHWTRLLTPEQRARVEAAMVVHPLPGASVVCQRGEPVEGWIGVVEGLARFGS